MTRSIWAKHPFGALKGASSVRHSDSDNRRDAARSMIIRNSVAMQLAGLHQRAAERCPSCHDEHCQSLLSRHKKLSVRFSHPAQSVMHPPVLARCPGSAVEPILRNPSAGDHTRRLRTNRLPPARPIDARRSPRAGSRARRNRPSKSSPWETLRCSRPLELGLCFRGLASE